MPGENPGAAPIRREALTWEMAIAPTVERELSRSGIDFQLLHHSPARFSLEAAYVSRVPPARVAKGVLLQHRGSHALAVIGADALLEMGPLRLQLGRDVVLAADAELGGVFYDCVSGAVPPLGTAYGIETWIDERLLDGPDVCFEAGDHELLVRVRTQDFLALLTGANVGRFASPAISAAAKRFRPARSHPPSPWSSHR